MSATLRARLALAAAVVFALAAAGWQAQLHWSARNPVPEASIALGETMEVDGATYRLDAVTAAPRLPSNQEGEEWVEALEGAVLVQVIVTTEIVSDEVDPETNFCEATAFDAEGRRWRPDTTVGYRVAGPEAINCRGSIDHPIRPHEPMAVGFVFLVPADAAETLAIDLSLGYGDPTVRLTP